MTDSLNEAFHQAMLDLYQVWAKHGYRANRFLQMVYRHRGLGTAKRLLRRPGPYSSEHGSYLSEGLIRLWELGIAESSMEALVLQYKWEPLFTDEERQVARERLKRLKKAE